MAKDRLLGGPAVEWVWRVVNVAADVKQTYKTQTVFLCTPHIPWLPKNCFIFVKIRLNSVFFFLGRTFCSLALWVVLPAVDWVQQRRCRDSNLCWHPATPRRNSPSNWTFFFPETSAQHREKSYLDCIFSRDSRFRQKLRPSGSQKLTQVAPTTMKQTHFEGCPDSSWSSSSYRSIAAGTYMTCKRRWCFSQ